MYAVLFEQDACYYKMMMMMMMMTAVTDETHYDS